MSRNVPNNVWDKVKVFEFAANVFLIIQRTPIPSLKKWKKKM